MAGSSKQTGKTEVRRLRESDPSAMRGAMIRTRGREPSDGERPGYEKVAAWLNGEPTYPNVPA